MEKLFRYKLIGPNLFAKDDPRYQKWRKSLKKRPISWNKGLTKETSNSVNKISQTFLRKELDNFSVWRAKMKKEGKIRSAYPDLLKNGDLAELIGVVLGDGHIDKCPRTDGLMIFSNSNNNGFIERYSLLIERIFDKKPTALRAGKGINCIRIRIYQKKITDRLEVPAGNRSNLKIEIPEWISKNREFLIRYLRGLYEAEACFCVHKPTGTYKLLFSNRNESLRKIVFDGLEALGFHPHISGHQVQISRKEEVYKCKELLKFRQY